VKRLAATAAMLLAAATACTGSGTDVIASPGSSTSHSSAPAPNSDASTLVQMRPVLEAIPPTADAPEVTCGGSPTRPCTSAKLALDDVVLHDAQSGVVYRLGPVVVSGADVASAHAVPRQVSNEQAWAVELTLTPNGADRFGKATAAMVGQSLAIVVDGVVVSAPTIQGPITEGGIVITGDFSEEEADRLATALSPG
jgi:preprotein translocase subunit SecD